VNLYNPTRILAICILVGFLKFLRNEFQASVEITNSPVIAIMPINQQKLRKVALSIK
jgi:ABC-type uncharacterized transport system permease subunit